MNKNNDIVYPVTKETMHAYAKRIFDPVMREECATTIWVPMAGRRILNKFVIENIHLFEKELPHYDKYLLVYVEPLDLTEESLVGYLKVMGKSFIEVCRKNPHARDRLSELDTKAFEEEGISYAQLLEKLRILFLEITDIGLEIILFLGEFDELSFASKVFYNNLKSLWNGLYPRLHYIFLMRTRVTDPHYISQWGELTEILLQNIIAIPMNERETDYLLDYFSNMYSISLSQEERKTLVALCGPHPYMLKVACRFLFQNQGNWHNSSELENLLRKNHVLESISSALFHLRTEEEQNILKMVVQHISIEDEDKDIVTFLCDLGYIKKDKDGGMAVPSKFFEEAITDTQQSDAFPKSLGKEVEYDSDRNAIVYKGIAIDEKFTHQEHEVLAECLRKKGQIVTREDLGEALWGKDSYDRYSDWAIDQLMSKLRKKLGSLGSSTTIRTLRGRGYKITTR